MMLLRCTSTVPVRTVQLWANGGVLDCWKTEGGHRRILRVSVERLLARREPQSSVRLSAPRAAPSGGAEIVGADATAATPAEVLRILVVDDEPALLRLYRLQLARWPLAPEVATASNGIEGLVILGRQCPHLLIADLNMPEMDGFRMLRMLRGMPQLDDTEIVVVTGLTLKLSVIVLDAVSNELSVLLPLVPGLERVLSSMKPQTYTLVSGVA